MSNEDVYEGAKFTREKVQVSDLEVDLSVQRSTVNMNKVRKFRRRYNPDALGEITVSRRANRSMIVLDGQHRMELVRLEEGPEGTLDAKVFMDLTKHQEGRIFLDLNGGDKPNIFDRYRVGAQGTDVVYTEIDKIVHRLGLKVGPSSNDDGTITAVAVLERVYNLTYDWETQDEPADHNILSVALSVITDAWGNQSEGLQGSAIECIGKMIQYYDSQLELPRLTDTLRNIKGGPGTLVNSARGYANLKGRKIWQAMGEVVVEDYNKYLGKNSPRLLRHFSMR